MLGRGGGVARTSRSDRDVVVGIVDVVVVVVNIGLPAGVVVVVVVVIALPAGVVVVVVVVVV